jgi:hypothetical protein
VSAKGFAKHAVSVCRVQLNTAIFLKVGQPFLITIMSHVMTADSRGKDTQLLFERVSTFVQVVIKLHTSGLSAVKKETHKLLIRSEISFYKPKFFMLQYECGLKQIVGEVLDEIILIFIRCIIIIIIIIIITYSLTHSVTHSLTYLLTAVAFSLGGSSPYTSTDKTNKNKYT